MLKTTNLELLRRPSNHHDDRLATMEHEQINTYIFRFEIKKTKKM